MRRHGDESLNRRDFGRHAGAAATLAAARAVAPFLFAGCTATGMPDGRRPIRVGLLHSQTGTMAISETSLRDVELFAFERINALGGLLGRKIETWGPDTKSRTDLYPKRARELLDWGAAAVFGCWASSSRKAVLPLFEEHNRLLFYPVQYEGNESSPHVVYGGMVPNQQIMPLIDWMSSPAGGGRRRIFLLGSDYVYPRTANFVAKKYMATKGMQPVGEMYFPMGHRDFSPIVSIVEASGADCVLNTINGDSNVGLFAALAAARIDPEKLPVVSTSIAEDELRNMLPEQVRGHLAASCYFQSMPSEENRRWVADFKGEFGHDRVTGDPLEPQWCLVHLWKAAVEKAGTFETEAVRQAMRDGLEFQGPGGLVRLDPKTQHCSRFFRVGRIRSDRQFDIVHSSETAIEPDPYPQVAFPGWSCDWTKGGITRGPEVSIDGDI